VGRDGEERGHIIAPVLFAPTIHHQLADKHGYKFMEVSAKTGQNMDQVIF
jgi:hypothetical protein